MNGVQELTIFVAAALGSAALLGAIVAALTLARAGRGLRKAADALSARSLTVGEGLQSVNQSLVAADAAAERALWTLGNLDERIDRVTVDLRSKRVASDTLRLRMIEGRLTIARLRQLVRLMIRLSEMRRAFL